MPETQKDKKTISGFMDFKPFFLEANYIIKELVQKICLTWTHF